MRWLLLGIAAGAGATAVLLGRSRHGRRRPGCALVVKLGGAALTDKQTFETPNQASLDASAEALALAAADSAAGGIVVVHGAGSFGHFQAREFCVSKGAAQPSFSWLGFALTRQSVGRLNQLVLDALLRRGVAAVSLPPFATGWRKGDRRSARSAMRSVRDALAAGFTPVLHGDAVFTPDGDSCVLSGDDLLVALCDELRPQRAVFLTDVPGVFDRPPSESGALLIRRIHVSPDGALTGLSTFQASEAAHDVTGGIRAKVDAAAAIASRGVTVIVCEAGTLHAEAALRGLEPAVCTTFVPVARGGGRGWGRVRARLDRLVGR